MDERFRGKGLWFGLGAGALIFLCLLLIAGAFIAVLAPARMAPVYVQPPAAGEGALQPPAAYYGPGLLGGLFFGLKMLFKLAFLGLLLLLLFGVVRRLFWGPHYCAPVPSGKGWEGQPGGGFQPHTHWRRHWHHPWGPPPWWGPAPERAAGEGEAPGAPQAGEATTGYSGPQE
jgi:hypothetical protein